MFLFKSFYVFASILTFFQETELRLSLVLVSFVILYYFTDLNTVFMGGKHFVLRHCRILPHRSSQRNVWMVLIFNYKMVRGLFSTPTLQKLSLKKVKRFLF